MSALKSNQIKITLKKPPPGPISKAVIEEASQDEDTDRKK
jgi:hypothetical protein